MRIRLRTTLAGPDLAAGPGDVIIVPPELGTALIEAGYAIPDSEESEQAVALTPETATAAPQRRRRR